MSDSHDHSHDTSDEDLNELINSLSQVIDKGTPEVVLENVEDDDVVSEALATLYEMDSLGVISSLPSITPDWSLAIRRFLETYSEGVEVEDDLVHWKWKAPLIHSWEESKERKEVAGVRPQVMMEALAIPSGSPGSNNDSSSPSKETGKSNHPIHLHTP